MTRRSKRSPKRHSDGEKSSEAIAFPLDITIDILSRLPLKSLVRFQCVSKLWLCLITDTIKTRSLSQSLLVMLQCHLDQSPFNRTSHLHSSTYVLKNTNTTTLISSEDKDSRGLFHGLNCDLMYRYVRGLVCCKSRPDEFAVFNPTTKQTLLLPKVSSNSSFVYGLFGYDPVENQYKVLCFIRGYSKVFTLPSTEKQQWRDLGNSQDNFAADECPTSSVCINGIIYYIVLKFNVGIVLGKFDVRFERFGNIKLTRSMKIRMCYSELINYQGKLGCIGYRSGGQRVELWIMEDDIEKQVWSKITFPIPPHPLNDLPYRTCGVSRDGDIVLIPLRLDSAESYKLYAYYYDPKKQNETRRVELESTLEKEVRVYCEPDHFENTMSLVLPTCDSKKEGAKRRFMKKSATTVAYLKKQLLAIAFFCAAPVCLVTVATVFSTGRVPVELFNTK